MTGYVPATAKEAQIEIGNGGEIVTATLMVEGEVSVKMEIGSTAKIAAENQAGYLASMA